jgi:hypothetical protein
MDIKEMAAGAWEILKPLRQQVCTHLTNRYEIQKELEKIIVKIEKVLQDEKSHVFCDERYEEIQNKLNVLSTELEKEPVGDDKHKLKLHWSENKEKNSRKKILAALNSTKIFFQNRCSVNTLDKILRDLNQVKTDINPLPHCVKKAMALSKFKIIAFATISAIPIIVIPFVANDQLNVVPRMRNECGEMPWYRSNEQIAKSIPQYRSIVEESYAIVGNTCLASEGKNHLILSKTAFFNLKKINPKNIQATFFLEVIPLLSKSKTNYYEKSISLVEEYVNNPKNYDLKKEDFDVVIKIAHVLESKQEFEKAFNLYNFILTQYGHDEHVNALLGICTTHIGFRSQNDKTKKILERCEQSVEVINKITGGKDDKENKQPMAHFNYGCILLRNKNHSDAEKQFVLGENNINGNDQNIQKGVSFSRLLSGQYEKNIEFVDKVIKDSEKSIDTPNLVNSYKDMQMTSGLAYLGLARKNKKANYYNEAYNRIDKSGDILVKEMYLKKINLCKNGKDCLAAYPPKNDDDNIKITNHIHSRIWPIIIHHQLNPNVANSPLEFPDRENKNEGKSCSLFQSENIK